MESGGFWDDRKVGKGRHGKSQKRDFKPGGPTKRTGVLRILEDSRSRRLMKKKQMHQQWRLENSGSCPEPTPQELAEWLQSTPALVAKAVGGSVAESVEAILKLKKLIFYGRLGPEDETKFLDELDSGALMSKMYAFLLEDGPRRLQCLELLCVLSYIPTQRQHAAVVFNFGIIQALLFLAASSNERTAMKAMQVLGSISIMDNSCHHLVYESDAFCVVCKRILESRLNPSVLKYGSFALMMITYAEAAAPAFNMVELIPAAEILVSVVDDPDGNKDTLFHISTALSNVLRDGPAAVAQREAICNSSLFIKMLEALTMIKDGETLGQLMKSIYYITNEKSLLDGVIEKGLVTVLKAQMTNPIVGGDLKRDMCHVVNNLVVDSQERLAHIVQHGLLEIMCSYAQREDFGVRKMAILALNNCAAVSPNEVIREHFAKEAMIRPFVQMLDTLDDSAAYYSVMGLSTILASGELVKQASETNPYTALIEELGGRDALHRLTERRNPNLSETAGEVLDGFYGLMEDDEVS